jgi:flagellar motor switch protein FliM
MTNILSQEEVDALLRGISGGDIETEKDEYQEPGGITTYDLTSQDRIIRGRMPTLEMTNEKYARTFRATLSSILRKVITVTAVSADMIKFGEFLKTLPVPTSLHLFRMDPMRGNAIFVVESKIIFTLVDIIFGGTGTEAFKIEGREFTAIENNLIKKIVLNALVDLEKCWKPLIDLTVTYQRAEINPQFVQIVPPTDVVVVMNFEVEVEYTTGVISICIPYSMLEPIKEKLSAGFQSEQLEVDKGWSSRFKTGLMRSYVEMMVELGRVSILGRDIVNLKIGDVIQLDHYASDPLDIYVEGIPKYKGYPGIYKGNQAMQISQIVTGKEDMDYGTE